LHPNHRLVHGSGQDLKLYQSVNIPIYHSANTANNVAFTFVWCAVRALGRVRARAPPLPPCLRGKTGAGGPEQAGGKWSNQSTDSESTARGSMVAWTGRALATAEERRAVKE